MINKYIEHFKSGDINVHKDSQRAWIKDKSPIVESNIGWIEHYVDPSNKRALWDGWVAIVDKERSKKFKHLVENAESVIATLPWPKAWEKDTFIAPDFTSLDIVSFGGDAMPKGINIPNYNEIREKEGFKNVIFEDNKPKNRSAWEQIEYLTKEESLFMHEHSKEAYRVMVAGHELFGHGSGKQILKDPKTGKCPLVFEDPVDHSKFESCYEKEETYNNLFGEFSSSYEECRADLSGLFLSKEPKVYKVFDYPDSFAKDLLWLNTMGEVRKGALGQISAYNLASKKWKQAHT